MSRGLHPGANTGATAFAVAAFVSGLSSVAAELASVRLLAPWFGQSEVVWANAVGVTLLALALGSWVGGRLADRDASGPTVALVLALAALWLAAASRAGPALGAFLAPSDVGGDRPLPLSFWGSLAATAVLVGPPVLATAITGPVAVRRLALRWGAGRAAGTASFTNTLGGCLACVLVPSAAVPALGSRNSVALGALLLALSAVTLAFARGAGGAAPETRAGSLPDRFAVPRRASGLVLVAAFLVGLVATAVEFAGVRALAPSFGQTSGVWATVIGVVIAALALGYGAGGVVAGRAKAPGRAAVLSLVLACATTFLASRPAPFVGMGLALHAALRVGVPTFFLGAAGPSLVRVLASERTVGRAAGAVFAIGTLGSLLGCYAAPLVSLPAFGTTATFTLSAALCAAAGLAVASAVRIAGAPGASPAPAEFRAGQEPGPRSAPVPRRLLALCASAAGVVAAGVALALPRTPLRADDGLLEERETAYQTVRVVERETEVWPRAGSPFESLFPQRVETVVVRYAGFDEDLGSYQSVRFPKERVGTAGRYYDHLALGAWFSGQPYARERAEAPRVLVVGYAGGTLHRVIRDLAPAGLAPRVTGVEIDPEVVSLARKHLGLSDLEDDRLDLRAGEDGRAVVASLPEAGTFDLVVVDAYQRTQYVPFHLATVEFFRLCARRLAPTGAIGVNVFASAGLSGRVLRSIASTMLSALGEEGGGGVWIVPNPEFPGSAVVWGTRRAAPPRLPPAVPAALEVPAFALDRLMVRHVPEKDGGEVWTDDRAPVERWTDEVLAKPEGEE